MGPYIKGSAVTHKVLRNAGHLRDFQVDITPTCFYDYKKPASARVLRGQNS